MRVVSRGVGSGRGRCSSRLFLGEVTVCSRGTEHEAALEGIRRVHRSSCKHGNENWPR